MVSSFQKAANHAEMFLSNALELRRMSPGPGRKGCQQPSLSRKSALERERLRRVEPRVSPFRLRHRRSSNQAAPSVSPGKWSGSCTGTWVGTGGAARPFVEAPADDVATIKATEPRRHIVAGLRDKGASASVSPGPSRPTLRQLRRGRFLRSDEMAERRLPEHIGDVRLDRLEVGPDDDVTPTEPLDKSDIRLDELPELLGASPVQDHTCQGLATASDMTRRWDSRSSSAIRALAAVSSCSVASNACRTACRSSASRFQVFWGLVHSGSSPEWSIGGRPDVPPPNPPAA